MMKEKIINYFYEEYISFWEEVFFWIFPMTITRKLIQSWKITSECNNEKDYELSLLNFLKNNLYKTEARNQYGFADNKIDIVLDEKVAIELKYNISKSSGELQRAMGQISQYSYRWNYIFLVICGKISENHKIEINKFYDQINKDEEKLEIIYKDLESICNYKEWIKITSHIFSIIFSIVLFFFFFKLKKNN